MNMLTRRQARLGSSMAPLVGAVGGLAAWSGGHEMTALAGLTTVTLGCATLWRLRPVRRLASAGERWLRATDLLDEVARQAQQLARHSADSVALARQADPQGLPRSTS